MTSNCSVHRGEPYRCIPSWDQPATERQLQRCREFGWPHYAPLTVGSAAEFINAAYGERREYEGTETISSGGTT